MSGGGEAGKDHKKALLEMGKKVGRFGEKKSTMPRFLDDSKEDTPGTPQREYLYAEVGKEDQKQKNNGGKE